MHEYIANVAPYGVSPQVRIPDKERWMIKHASDAGAHGITIPSLSTAEEMEEVVALISVFILIVSLNIHPREIEVLAVPFQSMR